MCKAQKVFAVLPNIKGVRIILDLYCLVFFLPASHCWDYVCFHCVNKDLPLIAADRSPNQLFLPV